MLKIYGSLMCSDCTNCMKNFDHYGIAYEFMDCCASLRNLSIFLEMRDENLVFDRLKAIHDIGFPAIVKEDGTVFTDWETYLKEQGKEIIIRDGAACSIQ